MILLFGRPSKQSRIHSLPDTGKHLVYAYHSIAASTLRSAGIRIALLVFIATFLAYFHFFQATKMDVLDNLIMFSKERADREKELFFPVEDNLKLAQQGITDRLEKPLE